jgi:hypothetical protein
MKNRIIFFIALLSLTTGLSAQVTVTGSNGADNNYARLALAFNAINGASQTGTNIVITLTANTTETATAVLNAGTWTTLSIYPTVSGVTVTGNLAVPLINLNGADNVTIDGRVGASGSTKDLTITNTGAGNAITIQFINSAQNNTIQYCKIKGSGTNAARGVIFFTTSAAGTGNDGNKIDNNDFSGNAAARPANVIYSAGTATRENSDNIISNNNFSDFLNKGIASNGIYVAGNNSIWTISGNSFYETSSFVPTASVTYYFIRINSATGVNFSVTDNFIGGSAPSCSGTWTKTNAFNNIFFGIYITAGTATASNIQNNTIRNIDWSNSLNANWTGIQVAGGNVNIGTVTGNNIGDITGTGSIIVTGTTTNNVYGINLTGTGVVNCGNNNIGSITAANAAANASNFYGISKSAAGTTTISNNTIGSTSSSNSIFATSASTGVAQIVAGISNSGTGTVTISSNTIANLTNGTTNATAGTAGRINGITSISGTDIISDNIIHDLTIGNANTALTQNASVSGIALSGVTPKNVTGNTIYNLSNSYATFSGIVNGLYYAANTAGNAISNNFIHSLSVTGASSTTASIYGIKIASGASTYSNNIITLGGNTSTTVYGIYETGAAGNNNNLYFNTVYVGGSLTAGAANLSYALYSAVTTNTRNFRNNIFVNDRSTSGGSNKHYSAYIVTAGGTITCDYNDYQASGTGGTLGYYGANKTVLPIVTGQDGNSRAVSPGFALPGGTTPTDYVPSAATLRAATGTGIGVDYAGTARSSTFPSMGAFEITIVPNVQVYKASVLEASYTTLKESFDAINSGTHTGVLEIRINNSTNETASAVLNASGTGSANYTSVLIFPTTTGLSVSGNLAAPLISLNGADNVTLDGRVNASGATRDLTVTNKSISAVAGTSTIRFINDANNNIVNYCILKGSTRNATSGILLFSTTTGTTGNDGNTVDNNDITNSLDANRPFNAIYSAGTAANENSGNTISNNNIYDFLNRATASNGINLGANSTTWTISGNSFYETASFAATANVAYNIILINNATGTGFIIRDNFIGGTAALSGGTAWTKTNTFNNTFAAIGITAGTGTASDVQNNTIRNIIWANSGAATWTGINIAAGDVNAGTATGNIIGADSGTGSVVITSGATGANVYGINIAGTGITDCQKNIIGSITTASSAAANATNFYGINKTAVAGTTTISGNIIGSTGGASISASSASTGAAQVVAGINNAGTGTITISGNTIANLINGTTNATAGTAGRITGISSTSGTDVISDNIIRDLTIGNANNAVTQNSSVCGIALSGATAKNVTGNTIYNLSNTYASFAGGVTGIYYSGSIAGNAVSRNLIHSLTVAGTSTTASVYGIKIASGASTYSNNIITLGGNTSTTLYGIYETGTAGNNNNLYFNTVYIGGSLGSGAANLSYALYSAVITNSRNFRNNIFANARSTTGGTNLHFAAYIVTAGGTITSDNNDYWASGTGGVTGYYGAIKTVLPVVTGQDVLSKSVNPGFALAGGTTATDYVPSNSSLLGATGTGILTDYAGTTRSLSLPSMGAFEITIVATVQVYKSAVLQASYFTLKEAFDAINSGIINTGAFEIKINNSTNETATAVLNASGTGAAIYSSVLIYPTAEGVIIAGNLAAPLIDLNGADNVTIDGRINASGSTKVLTITNTSNSAVAGTSTVRFINDATNNSVKYCILKGSTTDAASGILFFSSTTGTTGNDGNTIDNNDITSSLAANRPVNAIYSSGTAANENSGNTLSNNNIYDFLSRATASNGINLGANTTAWSITGNSFYETASFAAAASVAYNVMLINNASGTGFTITGNYIGGNAPLCGGSAWTKTNTFNNTFTAINLTTGTGSATIVENNTIQNIVWANSGAATWTGINIAAGDVTTGTTTGNTIGATTGTGSIIFTAGATSNFYGINITSAGTTDCQNNKIGAITTANAGAANATNFYGINKTAVAGSSTISNNIIGSESGASISASSASTGVLQVVAGINNTGSGAITISDNLIANLVNGTTNGTAGTLGRINGISSTNGTDVISKNIIHDLTIGNANTSATQNASVCGIALSVATPKNVTGNTIYNLSNSFASFAGNVIGLYYAANTSGNTVSNNFIHSLSVTGGSSINASVYGIRITSGATTYSNNIITLGGNTRTTIYGIYETGAANNNNNLYFNTVYIGGSPTAGALNSYALYNNANTNTRNFRNNIFENARSNNGATGKHYAIRISGTTNLTIDYNDYYAPNTGGVLGLLGVDRITIGNWRTATGQDVNSLNIDPTFTSAGSTVAADYKIVSALLIGVTGTGITVDYGANPRTATVTMGAWEKGININMWRGTAGSSDWNTPANWTGSTVPVADANIIFDAAAVNNLQLDQNRSVTDITNTTAWRVVTNGFKLTIKGVIISGQIDASATGSTVEFAGPAAQAIPAGAFYNDQLYNLTVNNSNNLTFNGTLNLLNSITATSGLLDATTNSPVMKYGGSSAQTIASGQFLNERIYNLQIDNATGVSLNADFTIDNSLTINSGKVFSITAPYLLNVPGTITNNGGDAGFVIKSDGNGHDAKLINSTPSVPATVELYLSGGTINSTRIYHYFVPPVESMSILNGSSTTYPSTADVKASLGLTSFTGDLVLYSETLAGPVRDNGWLFFDGWPAYVSGFSSLLSTMGYNFHVNADDKITFKGLLNAADHSFSNLSFTSLGWNLVGNPYPCDYDVKGIAALTATGDNVDNTIYFNHDGGYTFYNVELGAGSTGYSNIVAPMQGFFVHVTATGTSLDLPASSKSGSVAGPVRSKKSLSVSTPVKKIKLVLNNGVVPDETIVCLVDNATTGFDSDYDAYKLFGSGAATPSIYTEGSAVKYALNSVPGPASDPVIIPVTVVLKTAGTYNINISEFENLEGMNVVLKHGTEETTLSKDASYSFTAAAGTLTDFQLVIGGINTPTAVEPVTSGTLKTWYSKDYLYISFPGESYSDKSSMIIYDLNGKPVYSNNLVYVTPGRTIQLPLTLPKGIYVTRLIINKVPYVSKIVVF